MKAYLILITLILFLNSCCKEDEKLIFKKRVQFNDYGLFELSCTPSNFRNTIFDTSTKELLFPIILYDTFKLYGPPSYISYSIEYKLKEKVKCTDMLWDVHEYNIVEIISAKRN